jgi:hypothetical protein
LARFAQKSGFGERRCGAKAASTKIFSLPKMATQSPRDALSAAIGQSPGRRLRIDRSIDEVRKPLRHRRFLQY